MRPAPTTADLSEEAQRLLASSRLEGFEPSAEALELFGRLDRGEISVEDAIAEMRRRYDTRHTAR